MIVMFHVIPYLENSLVEVASMMKNSKMPQRGIFFICLEKKCKSYYNDIRVKGGFSNEGR